MPLPFYPSFVNADDPSSGFEDGVSTPRFSHGYFPLRNRIGILVETHSWRTYPERVRATRNTVLDAIELTVANAGSWQALAAQADARASQLGGKQVALDYRATDKARTIDFLGYAYTRTPSEVSGASMTRYDESRPEVWKVPLRDEVVPDTVITAPGGGYVVPVEWVSLVQPWLDVHGVAYERIGAAQQVAASQFHASEADFAASSMEGHQRVELQGEWHPVAADILPGSLFVPIAQPLARLAVHILEPLAPDSIAAWGGFNNVFERKEYMEAYVAEAEARKMMAADPALKAEFEARLLDDPEFAASPRARLDFFYRRHPAWDQGYNVYPVLRVDTPVH
jgi:hypothetical protein